MKTLKNTDIKNKIVLYRAPYDIGTKEENGEYIIKDNSRIVATIPSIKYLLDQNCKIVIVTWVKRPENGYDESLSTKPHAHELSKLLDRPVKHIEDCVGDKVLAEINNMKAKDILFLENTRFHKEEFEDNEGFAKQLVKGSEIIVYDAFPQAHRKHSSTTGILRQLPSCMGFYMQSEVEALNKVSVNAEKPLTIIIGGAKISDKTEAINNLQQVADNIVIVGGIANLFFKAKGIDIKDSFVEDFIVDTDRKETEQPIDMAKRIVEKSGNKLLLPTDVVIANSIQNPTETRVIDINEDMIPNGWAILDIGPKTVENINDILQKSKTIFWNGPAGLFENELFQKGTADILKSLNNLTDTYTLISGGDTIEALNKLGNSNNIDYISLAGGAAFEMLAGKRLPVMDYLV